MRCPDCDQEVTSLYYYDVEIGWWKVATVNGKEVDWDDRESDKIEAKEGDQLYCQTYSCEYVLLVFSGIFSTNLDDLMMVDLL